MRRAALAIAVCAAALAAATLASCSTTENRATDRVTLEVAGPPIAAADTGHPSWVYELPAPIEGFDSSGVLAQGWSMLGREDKGAALGARDYLPAECPPSPSRASGADAVLDTIVSQAADTRIVILNESHSVTRHRHFSAELIARLRPLGYRAFAAETFRNRPNRPDPIEMHAELPYPMTDVGTYSREPVFGRLLREAKRLGYRFAAYEQIHDPDAPREDNVFVSITRRETAQAKHLAEIVAALGEGEKLFVHVGYSHAREAVVTREDGRESAWMAARLKALTGIDPLTISQTSCRGGGDTLRLASPPEGVGPDWFDIIVDHPLETFRSGRPEWRFEAGDLAVPIPVALRPTDDPLIIEAFAADEPFEAVPVDRVYVEPGETVPLALPPGRYTVRAVRPTP